MYNVGGGKFSSKTNTQAGQSTTGAGGKGFVKNQQPSSTSFGRGAAGTGAAGKGFGRAAQGAQQQQVINYQAVLSPDPIFTRIWNVRCGYNPDSPAYRFCYVFYNKRPEGDEEWPKTPKNFIIGDPADSNSQAEWIKVCKAMPDPDHLVPCPTYGFEALRKRREAQKEIVKELQERMSTLQSKLREMSSFYDTELSGIFYRIEKNMTKIVQLLMKVVGMFACQHFQGTDLTEAENKMNQALDNMRLELDKPGGPKFEISELEKQTALLVENRQKTTSRESIDSETKDAIANALKIHQDALEVLQRNIKEMKKKLSDLEAATSQ